MPTLAGNNSSVDHPSLSNDASTLSCQPGISAACPKAIAYDDSIRRVVVTGIGMVTPAGIGRDASWQGLTSGKTFLGPLTHGSGGIELNGLSEWGARCVLPKPGDDQVDPSVQLALFAAEEAATDARLQDVNRQRLGVVCGSSKGGLATYARLSGSSVQQCSFDAAWPDAAARRIAARWNIQARVGCPVAACATGLVSLIQAADWIRAGDCDAVLAGSSDAAILPSVMASYRRLGVLASLKHPACHPFGIDRTGFQIGEGAAILVLEELEHARARGAFIYAEWLDDVQATDPTGLVPIGAEGDSLAWALQQLQKTSSPDLIGYHGTGTRENDRIEAQVMQRLQLAQAPGFSVKGAIGHLLGGAGSVETAFALLALRDQLIPPTHFGAAIDPESPVRLFHAATPSRLKTAWKLSQGFGGHVCAVSLRRVE